MTRLRIAPSSPARMAELLDELLENQLRKEPHVSYDEDGSMGAARWRMKRGARLLLRWYGWGCAAPDPDTFPWEYRVHWRTQYTKQRWPGTGVFLRQLDEVEDA